ncbi:MAG TPA: NUDIX hydrolase [Acidimicrobiia bacterium]|nr:NUDIX hydrolase [Acidimicrobiia bacterium]
MSSFEVTSSRSLGRGIFLELEEVRLRSPSGVEIVRDIVRHPGGVGVLAVDDEQVWLIRQHRAAFGKPMDEIPAGKLDAADRDTEAAARRELAEELGATAGHLEHLATMAPSPGYTDEVLDIYLATRLEFGVREPDGEEEVQATVFALPVREALDRISRGEITDAKTQVALLEWNRRQA